MRERLTASVHDPTVGQRSLHFRQNDSVRSSAASASIAGGGASCDAPWDSTNAIVSPAATGNVPTVWGPIEPQEVIVENANQRAIGRPRFSAAIGMGASFDSVGFAEGHGAVPTFVGVLGIGDGLLGLNLGAYATSATRAQRQKDSPVDRLAVDLFGVVRPAARYQRDDHGFGMRVLHSLAAELGPGLERAGRSNISGTRFLIHVGATVDLPLSPEREATELRVRLGVRKNIGLYTPKLYGATASDVTEIRDTAAELYAALAVVF